MDKQHVYIVGGKGCGNYGGFETFLDKLTEYGEKQEKIQYHIAWKGRENKEFEYHRAHCFQINVPEMGPAQAIYFDAVALNYCILHIKKNKIKHPIVYILTCRIGPLVSHFQKEIHKLGGRVYLNPDGHEWMRAKWSMLVRKYWKYSERTMVRHSDLMICDSRIIEKYIQETYAKWKPRTIFIAYGADLKPSILKDTDEKVAAWYKRNALRVKEYYLIVGRFVPENSFETIIREFMKSDSAKDLAIITKTDKKFLKELENKLQFRKDSRIKFVGTVYDQELLKKIRENAYAYLHGHTVGGTNPSLLEALSSTELNLLIGVGFNREVAGDGALYWNSSYGNLASLIERADALPMEERNVLKERAHGRIAAEYTWTKITGMYEKLFLEKR